MKKLFLVFFTIVFLFSPEIHSQDRNVPGVFLLTCGPGTETYSRWGHSALRIVDGTSGTDRVYNWGVFDFNTPAFAWKFARGRLEYMLGVTTYERFIQEYFMEGRWMQSQKINIEPAETEKLIHLIQDNLRPENVKYRYDFFYDDCATRIRDLLEKVIGENMVYSPEIVGEAPSFRFLTGKYLMTAPWLKLGIDLLMGSPGNKKATVRDRMFLPLDMQKGLSDIVIYRNGKMIPLLQNPVTVLEKNLEPEKTVFFTSPLFILSVLLVIVIILSAVFRDPKSNRFIDIIIFSLFSVLALLMIFFNFFTDHQQMKLNPNAIWLNPFILLCLLSVILKRDWQTWFRIVFVLNVVWLFVLLIFPHSSNTAFMPLVLVLIVRSSVRSGYSWNPLTLPDRE